VLAFLAVAVAFFGARLIALHDQLTQGFHLVIGILLLLFCMRWLLFALLMALLLANLYSALPAWSAPGRSTSASSCHCRAGRRRRPGSARCGSGSAIAHC
jgi:hypothetical protein